MSEMTSTLLTVPLAQVETPLLAVALAQGAALPPSLAELERSAGGALARAITSGDFKGKRDEAMLLYPSGGKAQRILLVGVGKSGEVTRSSIRRAAGVAAKRARSLGVTQLAFAIAPEARNGVAPRDLGQVIVEGAGQGAWAFTELKAAPEDPKPEVETVAVVSDAKEATEVAAGQKIGEGVAAGHQLARYLQMLPGNVCTPSYLADRAKQLAAAYGFGLTVLDRAAIQKEGMGALLAVAQGTQQEPRFIALEYRGGEGDAAPVALVGKGVTFDSGGISIKPAQNMEDMKFDMSGAAAVLDAATLTGAVVVALGHVAIGVMGNDEVLIGEVRDAGERAGERCWPLPLWDDYRELLKSDIADVKNSGGRGAGTIAGGWFLREFVNGFPWAHLDIAGTAYTDGEPPHQTKGPTAIGVRLFTEFLLKRAEA